ncbi:MAG: hypothetical protein ACERKN_03270 [Velocimicrobium sp.]
MLIEKEYLAIGFAGCGQVELIAGCAAFYKKENKKLLCMDFSKTAALRSIIPLPQELEQTKNVVLSYRTIDYIHADPTSKIQDFAFDYDIVLIDFGREINHRQIEDCDKMYYVTDMLRHNVLLLKQCERIRNRHMVLKHYLPGGNPPETYAQELNIDIRELFVLPYVEKQMLPFLSGTSLDKIKDRCFGYDTKKLIKTIVKEERE